SATARTISDGADATISSVSGKTTVLDGADAYVASGKAGANYGSASSLKVVGKPATWAYVKFDLSTITATVTSATLQVWAKNQSSVGFDVRAVSSSWAQKTITWRNAPLPSVLSAGRSGSFSGSKWV